MMTELARLQISTSRFSRPLQAALEELSDSLLFAAFTAELALPDPDLLDISFSFLRTPNCACK
jgi:hypothetical protein